MRGGARRRQCQTEMEAVVQGRPTGLGQEVQPVLVPIIKDLKSERILNHFHTRGKAFFQQFLLPEMPLI